MLEKVYIDQSDVLRQSVLGRGGGGGSDDMGWDLCTNKNYYDLYRPENISFWRPDLSCTVLVSPKLSGFEQGVWKGSTLSTIAQEITKQFGRQGTQLI